MSHNIGRSRLTFRENFLNVIFFNIAGLKSLRKLSLNVEKRTGYFLSHLVITFVLVKSRLAYLKLKQFKAVAKIDYVS